MNRHKFTLTVETVSGRAQAERTVLSAFARRQPDGCVFTLEAAKPPVVTLPKPSADGKSPPPANIAVSGGKLAIFASPMGFAGEVIQQYTEFTDEATAIAEARAMLAANGIPCEEEITRPMLTKITYSYERRKR